MNAVNRNKRAFIIESKSENEDDRHSLTSSMKNTATESSEQSKFQSMQKIPSGVTTKNSNFIPISPMIPTQEEQSTFNQE